MYKANDFITIPLLPSILEILPSIPEKWGSSSKMVNFDAQKSEYEGQKKKDFPRIHIDMAFLQKTGSKLVNFGLHGLLYILQTPIGGRHPVPCLTTQITERRGTAMYYPLPGKLRFVFYCLEMPVF